MSGMKSRRKLLLAVAILAAVLVLGLLLKGMDAGRSEASGSAEEDLSSETAQLLANAGGTFPEDISADEVESYTVDKPLKTASSQLMESYEDRGDCVLLEAQYLDLIGKVWGFSVEGQGWADVCILKETGSGKTQVEVVHLEAVEGSDGS